MANTSSFYDDIMNSAQSLMEKEASANPETIEKILNDSDMSESELSKIAAQIDNMLDDDADDELDDNAATADEGISEDDNVPTEDEPIEDDSEEENLASEDEDSDFSKLAEYYDEVYEKYASEGLGVADYAFNQMGCPDDEDCIKLATSIGEAAEKLAYVSEISPFAVADDLLLAVADEMGINDTEE